MDEPVAERRRLSITERIDLEVRRSAADRPRKGWFVLGALALFAAALVAGLVPALVRGNLDAVARVQFSLVLLGAVLPFLVVITAAVLGRGPGALTWVSLVAGGLLVALGPVLVLAYGGSWDTQVHTVSRLGFRYSGSLRSAASVEWGLALVMIVPGVLGCVSRLRSRSR